MKRAARISATMTTVLEVARAHDGVLIMVSDGPGLSVWTWPGCPTAAGGEEPEWRTFWPTVKALLRRGDLEVTKRANARPVEVRIKGMMACVR